MDGPGWRVGSRFGPYELRALLGRGGMGEVYEAYDTVENRVVAIKLLPRQYADDPAYQVRFRRESQAAARLADPHIVPIHDWGVIEGALFIDMLRVPGADLRAILRTQGPITAERTLKIIDQIAAALDAAHAEGLVHRDVKPANILVTDADFAYLADFGIAHTEGDAAVTGTGAAVASYIYMAPERFDVGPVTGFADVYSLTCVLHECLTGTTPFPASSTNGLIKAHLTEPPPRPSQRRPGLSLAVDEVIARGMAKNPTERYPTATAMAQAARTALAAPPAPTGPTFVVRTPDPSRFGQTESVAPASSLIPPEATGEFSIIPTAATSVHPSEIQFSPLPSARQEPAAPVPMRSFPDAHLYPEEQRYGDTEGDPQWSPSISGPYPPAPSGPAGTVAPVTRKYGTAAPEPQPPVAPTISRAPSESPAPHTVRYGDPAAPMTQRFEPVAAPLDAYASIPQGYADGPQGYDAGSSDEDRGSRGYEGPQGYDGGGQSYEGGPRAYGDEPERFDGPQAYDGGSQGYGREPKGFDGGAPGYDGGSQGYGREPGFDGGPQGYDGGPQGYGREAQGFDGGAQGYDGGPQRPDAGPQGYDGGTQRVGGQPLGDAAATDGYDPGAQGYDPEPQGYAGTQDYYREAGGYAAGTDGFAAGGQGYAAGTGDFGADGYAAGTGDSGADGYDSGARSYSNESQGYDPATRQYRAETAGSQSYAAAPGYGGESPGADTGARGYDATAVSSDGRAPGFDSGARDYDATVLRQDIGAPNLGGAQDNPASGYDATGQRGDANAPNYETTVLRGAPPVTGFDSSARGFDAASQRGEGGAAGYDPDPREYDATVLRHDAAPQGYPARPGYDAPAAETGNYDGASRQAPGDYPDAGYQSAQAYSDYHPEPHRSEGYGAQSEYGYDPAGDYGYEQQGPYTDDYPDGPYRQEPARRRSILAPLLITAAVIVVLAVAGAIGWTMLRPGQDADVQDQAGPVATGVAPRGTTPGGAQPSASSTTSAAATTTAALPAGAKTCSTGRAAPGSFTQSATGSEVTSCPFAEAVRQAYAESAAATSPRAPRSVVAVSPVTGRSYTMNCVAEGQVVTCSGGENAVVYIY